MEQATGKIEEAETIVADMKAKIEEIKSKVAVIKEEDKQRVYIEIYPGPAGYYGRWEKYIYR